MITAPHYDHHEMMASRTAAFSGTNWMTTKSFGSTLNAAGSSITRTQSFKEEPRSFPGQPRREGDCSLFLKYSSPANPMVVTRSAPVGARPRDPDQGAHEVFPQFSEVADSCVAPSLAAPRPMSRTIIASGPRAVRPQRSHAPTTPSFSNSFQRLQKNQSSKTGTLTQRAGYNITNDVWRPQNTPAEAQPRGRTWTFHPAWTGL
ncbi:hypothetical protein SO694_00079159 [Aureococcus anophagefferens]|uniref:Uncharacterized protein n=1 Tax=Aureococcus anophagefferens TaxID=44056 RepID=A0ABR1FGY0_AURAN